MMAVYRKKYRDKKTGKVRLAGRFTAEFWHHGQLFRRGGFIDRESATHWQTAEQNKLIRGETGYVKPMLTADVRPLISEFADTLRSKGRDEEYAYIAERRLNTLADECGWLTLGNITLRGIELWQKTPRKFHGKTVGPRAKNQHVQVATQFCNWLVKPKGVMQSNPLLDVELQAAKLNSGYRRAGTIEEFDSLLASCASERCLYYTFRLYCPLRGRTIAQLTWRMMRLEDERPWIALPAAMNKSRADERSPLPQFLAQQMRRARGKAKADDLVFPDAPTLDDFRADLIAAGIAFDDGKGSRRLDYHAFRKTLVRWCKRAGVPMDDASQLLHHRDSRTTRKHYDEDAIDPELSGAVERLPIVGKLRLA
jgi:integrase